jgi:hypothetical protein
VLVAFNNFSAKESVPLLDEMRNLGVSIGGMDLGSKVGREGGREGLCFFWVLWQGVFSFRLT